MANFVLLNSENKVINIISVDDSDVTNNGGDFSTQAEEYIKNKYKLGNLKQYSLDGSVRFNTPGIGDSYDEVNDAFIKNKPFASWILNNTTFKWDAPIAFPNQVVDENAPDFQYYYAWSEERSSWVAISNDAISHVWNPSNSSWETI